MTQSPAYSAEHRGDHRKQDQRYWAAGLEKQNIHHLPTGDSSHQLRQPSDSQLPTSCDSPEH